MQPLENSLVPQKALDTAVPVLGYVLKRIERMDSRYLYTIIHCSCQKVETTQVYVNRLMDKQNIVYRYIRILFSHKRNVV